MIWGHCTGFSGRGNYPQAIGTQPVSAAPECGADTDDILRELGYSAEAIATLHARHVI
jgi:crotonobetainyl-CoA:carnitine CoA-transferase CaiB-like acyl-CoA transferase